MCRQRHCARGAGPPAEACCSGGPLGRRNPIRQAGPSAQDVLTSPLARETFGTQPTCCSTTRVPRSHGFLSCIRFSCFLCPPSLLSLEKMISGLPFLGKDTSALSRGSQEGPGARESISLAPFPLAHTAGLLLSLRGTCWTNPQDRPTAWERHGSLLQMPPESLGETFDITAHVELAASPITDA